MLEDLFITDAPGEVSGAGIDLSEDISNWPIEIQSALMSHVPALMNNPGQLNFDSVEQDKLYAKGSYVVQIGSSPDDSLVFPIIVKAGKLAPIDLYIYKGQWHPLDNEELQGLLTSPELGTGLMDEADIPPMAYNGMTNRISPPGAYNGGVVSSLATKMSALNRALSDDLIHKVQNNNGLLRKLALNKTAKRRFMAVLDSTEVTKVAENLQGKNVFSGDRVIYMIAPGKFSVKSASIYENKVGTGHLECDGDQLVTWLKEAGLEHARIIRDLKNTKMAFTWNDSAPVVADENAAIIKQGCYTCYTSDKFSPVDVEVVGIVKTASDEPRYLGLCADGKYVLQRELIGKSTSMKMNKTAYLKDAAQLRVNNIVSVPVDVSVDTRLVEFTPPTKIASVTNMKLAGDQVTVVSGTSFKGKVAYIVSSDSRVTAPVKTKYVPKECPVEKTAEVWYVPEGYPILSLPAETSSVIKSASDLKSAIRLKGGSHSPVTTIRMWNIDRDNVGLKIGSNEPTIASKTAAILLLKKAEGSGVMQSMSKIAAGEIKTFDLVSGSPGKGAYVRARAKDITPDKAQSPVTHNIKQKVDKMSALKVAAVMEDEEAVDTVLALNYLTPENMREFGAAIPEMKVAEEALAKLLMSTRLGNTLVEEQDVKNVLTSIHGIIKSLEGSM